MLNSIKETDCFKSLNLLQNKFHAYLFYSSDKELNNNVALNFAKILSCNFGNACCECSKCKQFDSFSNPDITIINQDSIKVEDVNILLDKLSTKPIASSFKLFIILNAENINEIAQNKLLKSLEEPNACNIFILTCSKTEKLLPTVLSRLHKVYVPKLTKEDKQTLTKEAHSQNIIMENYFDRNISLTEIVKFETDEAFKNTLQLIVGLIKNLKSTANIPEVALTLKDVNKSMFLPLLEDVFIDAVNQTNKYDKLLTDLIRVTYSNNALIKCLPLIENAHKKQMSNVNFGYIIDNLLFDMLKEKYLCK